MALAVALLVQEEAVALLVAGLLGVEAQAAAGSAHCY
jgi:hypothetical protein